MVNRLTGLTCSKAPGFWMVEHQLVLTFTTESYINTDCVSGSLYVNHLLGSKLWQLSTSSVVAFCKYIQVVFQADSSMTGRTYMGEVLTQVWLKSIKK